jgi:hypothetical protein
MSEISSGWLMSEKLERKKDGVLIVKCQISF